MSYKHQRQAWSDSPEIGSIAGDNGLCGPLHTNRDRGIGNFGRRSSR
jgi:hypothetical protein